MLDFTVQSRGSTAPGRGAPVVIRSPPRTVPRIEPQDLAALVTPGGMPSGWSGGGLPRRCPLANGRNGSGPATGPSTNGGYRWCRTGRPSNCGPRSILALPSHAAVLELLPAAAGAGVVLPRLTNGRR